MSLSYPAHKLEEKYPEFRFVVSEWATADGTTIFKLKATHIKTLWNKEKSFYDLKDKDLNKETFHKIAKQMVNEADELENE